MKNLTVGALVLFCVSYSAPAAQVPLPRTLLEGRVVFLEQLGADREWLDTAAGAVRRFDRFQLVGDQEDADLTFTLIRRTRNEGTAFFPFAGGGGIDVPIDQDIVVLVVRDRNERVVWDDFREIGVFRRVSGRIEQLVRELHEAIAQNVVDRPGRSTAGERSASAERPGTSAGQSVAVVPNERDCPQDGLESPASIASGWVATRGVWSVEHHHTFGSCFGEVLVSDSTFQYSSEWGEHSFETIWDQVTRVERTTGWGEIRFVSISSKLALLTSGSSLV